MPIIENLVLYLPSHPTLVYPKRDVKDIKYLIIHKTDSEDKGKFHAYDTARYHVDNRGWAGIGYHYFIIKDGSIFQTQPDYVISNHASNYNSTSLGIVITGDHRLPNSKDYTCGDNEGMLGKTQYKALVWTLAKLQIRHSIPFENILAHGQTGSSKSCPNLNMEQLKEDVKKKDNFIYTKGRLNFIASRFNNIFSKKLEEIKEEFDYINFIK